MTDAVFTAPRPLPTPLFMLTSTESLTFQLSVLLLPVVTGFGAAEKLLIVGNGTTVTVTSALTESPRELVAISWYVVVEPGVTEEEPLAARPLPIP